MVRTRRARQADRLQLFLGIGLIAAVLAVVAGVTMWRSQAAAAHPPLDPETQCPIDGPRSVTVVLVDRTDPISPVSQLALRTKLQSVAAETPQYGALYLYAIDGAIDGVAEPLFVRCNPGDPRDESGLTQSKAKVRKRFEQGFAEPLEAVLEDLVQVGAAEASPIMEALQGAALTAFSAPGAKEASPKTLIVVSDFMQNSDHVSFYRAAASGRLQAPGGLEAPLAGVEVGLLFIQRPGRGGPSIEELKAAWKQYFVESGVAAGDVRPVKLTGVNP